MSDQGRGEVPRLSHRARDTPPGAAVSGRFSERESRGRRPGRELGPLSRDVLAAIIEATDPGEGLARDEAVAVVRRASAATGDRFWETDDPDTLEVEVEDVLDGLVARGYLYDVSGELRVTDRDVLEGVPDPSEITGRRHR